VQLTYTGELRNYFIYISLNEATQYLFPGNAVLYIIKLSFLFISFIIKIFNFYWSLYKWENVKAYMCTNLIQISSIAFVVGFLRLITRTLLGSSRNKPSEVLYWTEFYLNIQFLPHDKLRTFIFYRPNCCCCLVELSLPSLRITLSPYITQCWRKCS